MGLRTTIANAIMSWAQRKAQAPDMGGANLPDMPIWTEWSTSRAIKEGYKASHIVYAVASDLADCIRSVPWRLMRDGEVVNDHPIASMLRAPNDEMTWGAICEAVDIYKSLAGNGYVLWKEIDREIKAWLLRPDRVHPIPDAKGHLLRYDYYIAGNKKASYDPQNVFHFKFFDPGEDLLGMPPLQAAARIVDTSNSLVEWNKQSLGNNARKDLLFSPKKSLTREQHQMLSRLIKHQVEGAKNAHGVLFPSEPMDVTALNLSPAELDYIDSFATYERAICMAFHVHPEAVGIGSATYENKRWAIRAKWEGPVTSRLREMRAVLNHKLRAYGTNYPPGKGDLYIDYDLSDTPAAIGARQEAAEMAKKLWAMGVPFNTLDSTLDLGVGAIPGGDVGYIPATLLPTSSGGEVKMRAVNPDEKSLRAHWKAIEQRKLGWIRGVQIKVEDQFASERKAVVKAIENGSLDTDVIVDSQAGKWQELITAIMRAVIEDFGGKQAEELRKGMPHETRDFDPWGDEVKKWVNEQTANHVKEIQETTKKAIRAAVLEGIDAGLDLRKIAKRVQQALEDDAKTRSFVIARTEVHTAASFGMNEAARQSGIVREKRWITAGDDRVRELHVMNEAAGWIPFDSPYPSGAMFPGDGGPEDVINCRCVEAYHTR